MNTSAIRLLLVSLALFGAVAALAGYILFEQERNGEMIREGLVSLKSWEQLRGNPQAQREVEEQLQDTERLRALVLQSESDTIGLLAYVDDLATRSRVTVTPTELKVVKTGEAGFDNLSAAFSITGSRTDVERAIALFERLPYRSHIDSLALTRAPAGASADITVLVSVKE